MTPATRDRLTILNSFVHDVATGTWISTLLLLTLLHLETRGAAWAPVAPLLPGLKAEFMALTWASLVVIAITGVIRALTFRAFGWTGDIAKDRVRLLKIKHALLGTTFLAGTIYMAVLAYSV